MPSKRPPPQQPAPDSSSSSSESEEEKTNSVPKRPIPPPQAHESSEEEEEVEEEEEEEEEDDAAEEGSGSEGEEEDSSEEEKEDGDPGKNAKIIKENQLQPQPQTVNPPNSELSSSDADDGVESDSESDSLEKETPPPGPPTRAADPSSKPVSLKSPDESPDSKKPVAANTEKRKRKTPEASGTPEVDETAPNGNLGKKLFQRVWTADDEIALLRGMVEYQENFGSDPSLPANINSVLEIVKNSFHVEFTKSQLYEKIRRLKGKYKTNLGRSKNGADPVLPKPHDQLIFDISKKIWGAMKETGDEVAVIGENVRKKRRPSKASSSTPLTPDVPIAVTLAVKGGEDGLGTGRRASNLYPTLHGIVTQLENSNANSSMCGSFKRALDLVNPERGMKLEEKWGRQCLAEMKLHTSRSELMKELVDTLIEALGSPTP